MAMAMRPSSSAASDWRKSSRMASTSASTGSPITAQASRRSASAREAKVAIDADVDAMRLDFRQSLAAELEGRIAIAIAGRYLPDQDARVAAPALVGALMEGLLGPLAPTYDDP